jgi:Fe2+ transport system protein FeoA
LIFELIVLYIKLTRLSGFEMTLADSKINVWYSVEDFHCKDEQLRSRFYKLGIFPGVKVMLKRKAPIFRDPLIFQIDDIQIIMTCAEAQSVKVSELI